MPFATTKEKKNQRNEQTEGKEQAVNGDVLINRFIGFGIAGAIDYCNERVRECIKDKDEKSLSMYKDLQKFGQKMRIFKEEALLSDDYLDKFCDPTQALNNNGYMAYVAPQYTPFATVVMNEIIQCFPISIFDKYGNDCFKESKEKLFKSEKRLLEIFQECGRAEQEMYDNWIDVDNDIQVSTTTQTTTNQKEEEKSKTLVKIDEKEIKTLFTIIVTKACHAYYGSQLNAYEQTTVKRKGKDHVNIAFRTNISTLSQKASSINMK
jgi:hypothetical protein